MAQEKQKLLEFLDYSRYQKFMNFHITNENALSFFKEHPHIEEFYILLFKYNITPFKE
jgi:hypothetical protein